MKHWKRNNRPLQVTIASLIREEFPIYLVKGAGMLFSRLDHEIRLRDELAD